MEMTNLELYIRACKYAVGEMIREGSIDIEFITSDHDDRQKVLWVEVMRWLNRELEQAEWLKTM